SALPAEPTAMTHASPTGWPAADLTRPVIVPVRARALTWAALAAPAGATGKRVPGRRSCAAMSPASASLLGPVGACQPGVWCLAARWPVAAWLAGGNVAISPAAAVVLAPVIRIKRVILARIRPIAYLALPV